MRVYDLAKQLEITNKELLDKIRSLNIEVKSHSSSIDDESVRMVLDLFEKAGNKIELPPPAPAAEKSKTGSAPKSAVKKKSTGKTKAQAPPKEPEAPKSAPPKLDPRALALQALERAKAKRAQQHQAMMLETAEVQPQASAMIAPEHQKVELGGVRTGSGVAPPETAAPPATADAGTSIAAKAAPPAGHLAPPEKRVAEPVPPGNRGPQRPAAPVERRTKPPQSLGLPRNVELQQLPSLPKRKTPAPPKAPKIPELILPPTIDVMKLRPTRRPAAKRPADKEAEKNRKRMMSAKGGEGGKRIRPGRFLNIASLEESVRGNRRRKARPAPGAGKRRHIEAPKPPAVIKIYGDVTLAEFAEKIQKQPGEIIMKAMALGEMVTLNKLISPDLCELLAADFGVEVEIVPENDDLDVAKFAEEEDTEANILPRPPVVTVMGHVDHGKTSLLDSIRNTTVAEGEHGGITQHIGAYHVETNRGEIVFLDTPGHAAFTAMRARGASVTDIVVLIVAADDGLMPQTIEAINHSRAANAPIIVAINKIDLPGANVQKVKNDLMQYSLLGEELGGDTIFCEISAKTGEGIDNLLEMIQLQSEMMELQTAVNVRPRGVVIESNIDPLRGTNATVLIQAGTLKQGQAFVCGDVSGRVRLMLDDRGQTVESASPAHPIKILGLNGCPRVGEDFLVLNSEKQARQIAQIREERRRRQSQNKALKPHVTLEGLSDYLKEEGMTKDLNIILKGDVQGSIEAVSDAMNHLSTEKVQIVVLHSGVGSVTESDVQLAMASDAIVIGFNVRPDAMASDLANMEQIEIKTYRVIYELLEELAMGMLGMLDAKYKEVPCGSAEIRQVFKVSRMGNIAGCYVTKGAISRNDKMRLVRDGTVVYEGNFASLRRVKDDVREVQSGYECGITIANFQDIKQGDVIETYTMEEVTQTL